MKGQGILKFTAFVYGRGFIARLISIGLLAAVTSAAQFILTWYLGAIIDSISLGLEAVLRYFWIISVAVVVNVCGNAWLGYASGRVISLFMLNLRGMLGDKLCSARCDALDGIKGGDLLSIVTNDVEGFRPWLAALSSIGHLPIKLLAMFVILFVMSWKLSLFMLPLLPLAMLPSLFLSRKLHVLSMAERAATGKTTGFVNNVLDFMIVVKSFCLESLLSAKNRGLLSQAEKTRLRRQLREQVIQTFGRCLGHVINPFIFVLGAWLILRGEMTVGQIVTVMLLLNIIGEALNLIYAIPTSLQGAKASMERVATILDLPDEPVLESVPASGIAGSSALIVRDLCFSYGETDVLANASFEVEAGEKIAIVGASGSGKSTLFKLISCLYSPTGGSIVLGGMDLSQVPVKVLRQGLSVVTQESFLFSGTIRSNLMIARPDAGDAEIIEACRNARIDRYVNSLEHGFDTMITDIGSAMSKGQMQRINLARAFLRRAPVWLLDEPVSALDPDTRAAIMNYIFNDTAGITVMMVLHGLEAPERFDRILVLDNGRVAGFGSHATLAGSNGAYRQLLDRIAQVEEEVA